MPPATTPAKSRSPKLVNKPASKRRKRALPRLVVRSSAIHAAGCVTLDFIPRRSLIIEYAGERLTKHEADLRYEDRFVTYLFGFGQDGDVIDGFSTAMFLNHSCDVNCETIERDERVFIVATRDIQPGEELVYNYHLYDSELEDQADCYCGSPNCRGTMYSEDEVKRRERAMKRRAAGRKRASPQT